MLDEADRAFANQILAAGDVVYALLGTEDCTHETAPTGTARITEESWGSASVGKRYRVVRNYLGDVTSGSFYAERDRTELVENI